MFLEFVTILDHWTYERFDFQRCIKVSSHTTSLRKELTGCSVKTIIILTYGWVSEGRLLTAKDSLGIVLALGGATLYSQLSQK